MKDDIIEKPRPGRILRFAVTGSLLATVPLGSGCDRNQPPEPEDVTNIGRITEPPEPEVPTNQGRIDEPPEVQIDDPTGVDHVDEPPPPENNPVTKNAQTQRQPQNRPDGIRVNPAPLPPTPPDRLGY